jgi:hypothetical protein
MQSTTEDVTQETPVTAAPRADAEAPGEAEPERETGPPPTAGEEPPTTATTAVVASPDEVPPGEAASGASGLGLPAVAVLLLLAALAGAAVVALVHRARSRARPGADPSGPAGDTAEERPIEPLARAAIDVRDRVRNPALAERLGAGLEATGWTSVDPTGDRFDPTRHVAVDREPTSDAGLGGLIATVERVGYLGPDGEVVRPPEVVVYAYAATGGGAA